VDLETGEVQKMVMVNEALETELGAEPQYARTYFAEGLELAGDFLIQLTWTTNIAFIYDLNTFERVGNIPYENEGWGLCFDGRVFYHSDSSQYIAVRDSRFQLVANMLVTLNGQPVLSRRLNELECVGDYVYANWWHSDTILKIDKYTGNVD
jgi:glutaminyl-peptide cyclotransferase